VKLKVASAEIRISVSALLMPVLTLMAGFFTEYTAVFFSMLLHELGHVAAAAVLSVRTDIFSFTVLGFQAAIQASRCSRKELIFIYAAGPAVNLLLFSAALTAGRILPGEQEYIGMLSMSNLFMGLFNLLPVMPLDGGQLLYGLLCEGMGSNAAGRAVRALAWSVSAMITAAGAYQLLITSFNPSLVIIGLYIMISLRTARLESALMGMREIIYRRSRLVRRGIYSARDLVAMKDTMLRESLKSMDFDRFHIVYVLDDDLRIIGTFTENEIIDALTEHDEELTFGQLVDIQKNGKNHE
jgi:stage IV sporulation protein FB